MTGVPLRAATGQPRQVSAGRHGLFFFNDTATTEIYTLSLHDALPISVAKEKSRRRVRGSVRRHARTRRRDRKSTRLNSSHGYISYAVFCLKTHTTTMLGALFLDSRHPLPPLLPLRGPR